MRFLLLILCGLASSAAAVTRTIPAPLPDHLDAEAALLAIDPAKDADGLHPVNLGQLVMGVTDAPRPCTPLGIQALLVTH